MSTDTADPVADLTDRLHRFSFANAPIRGQWVRLDSVLSALAGRRTYPDRVAVLLGEMLAAVAMVSESIQFDGSVSLQFRGSGPLTTVLAECRAQNALRAIARWPEEQTPPQAERLRELLGNGHLAITLNRAAQNPADPPFSYQGLIELSSDSLAGNLETYFINSEQLQTRLFFARSEQQPGGVATGLLLQRLPSAGDANDLSLAQDDRAWRLAQQQAGNIDSGQLASANPVDLLADTFRNQLITLHPPQPLRFDCSCSRERSSMTLQALPRKEILELLAERGSINVSCEICGASYDYDAVDIHQLLRHGTPTLH